MLLVDSLHPRENSLFSSRAFSTSRSALNNTSLESIASVKIEFDHTLSSADRLVEGVRSFGTAEQERRERPSRPAAAGRRPRSRSDLHYALFGFFFRDLSGAQPSLIRDSAFSTCLGDNVRTSFH
jgi:hypothetical protein